jgi:hypothetical protein
MKWQMYLVGAVWKHALDMLTIDDCLAVCHSLSAANVGSGSDKETWEPEDSMNGLHNATPYSAEA